MVFMYANTCWEQKCMSVYNKRVMFEIKYAKQQMLACERERGETSVPERERERVYVTGRECVCQRERESVRERDYMCVCVCV